MEKLSFNEISEKKQALTFLLDNEKEYDFDLVYAVNKNIKKIDNEIEEVRDILPEYPEELQEYQQKKTKIIQKAGGQFEQQGNAVSIKNPDILEDEELQKELEELDKEYSETLEKQKEITKQRQEKIDNKVIEIGWHAIKKEYFPKNIQPTELPIEILDLVEV